MAKKWLLTGVDRVTLAMDPKQLLTSATLSYNRSWASQGRASSSRRLLGKLHEADKDLSMAPYLRVDGSNARILLKIRTGSLWLNDRVSKFARERPAHCLSCHSPEGSSLETLRHFLLECPRYNDERENWSTGWSTDLVTLFNSHEPVSLLAALGEGVQFFGGRDDADELQQIRMLSIRSMWNKRCAIAAISLPPQLHALAPGVNAD